MASTSYDQIVIGGGFAGTAIAYQLARHGSNVMLIEAKSLLGGTSGACAGRVQVIESETDEYLELVWQGYQKLKCLGQELEYDLEWEEPGHLTLLQTEQEWKDYEALVKRLNGYGIPAQMLDEQSLLYEEPLLNNRKIIGAAYSIEGHVNPFKYCIGYSLAAVRFGGEVKTFCPVTGFEIRGERVERVITAHGRYSAGSYIVATGAWGAKTLAMLNLEFPVKFTNAEAQVSEPMPKILTHHIGLPGFYEAVHVQEDDSLSGSMYNVTLGAGQHKNGSFVISNAITQVDEIDLCSSSWGMPAVGEALLEYLPKLRSMKIVRTWAAPSPFMPDYLPAIGKIPVFENLYVGVGFHLAIPTIPVLSDDLARLIIGGDISQSLKQYDPARFFQ